MSFTRPPGSSVGRRMIAAPASSLSPVESRSAGSKRCSKQSPWKWPTCRLDVECLATRETSGERLFDRPILMGEADDEIAEEAVSGEAKRPEAYDADKDLVGCHPEARVEYQIAKSGIRRDHLGGHHGCKRIAHGKAHAGQDERQGRRQRHKNEYLERSGAEAGRGAQLVRGNMRDPDHRVD